MRSDESLFASLLEGNHERRDSFVAQGVGQLTDALEYSQILPDHA